MTLFAGEKPGRRRRSWYRRRLRLQRGLIAFAMVSVLGCVGWQATSRFLAERSRRISFDSNPSWTQGDIHAKLTAMATSASRAPRAADPADVYAYSVIPGGVRTVDDLQEAVRHDRLVWQHYAQFQYQHARLVRATEAREVYLSYRLRNHIYWTRKRHHLHIGELLITDGNITARTRCGNQVSDKPQPEVSEEEPEEDVLDRPVAHLYPAPNLPMHSSFTTPSLPTAEPVSPQYPEFGRGFIFPYVPFGVPVDRGCETPAQEAFEASHGIVDNESDEKRCRPLRHKPPVVPEPSTILLISSGLAAVYWQYRRARHAQVL